MNWDMDWATRGDVHNEDGRWALERFSMTVMYRLLLTRTSVTKLWSW